MKKELEKSIEKFKNSQVSLESYQAISDFIKIVETISEFINWAEKEGEKNITAQRALNEDKGWNYGLRGSELEDHNKRRARKSEALHQLDPIFPLMNLKNIHHGIQSDNILEHSDWLFHRFGPDEPLPREDREEYQMFLDKTYKNIIPFLDREEKRELDFDLDSGILYFQETEIKMSLKNDNTNAYYILAHIFKDGDLDQQFSFTEIAEDTFRESNEKWKKYYRACEDINKKVYKKTKIDDFLEFTSGKTGWVKINKKYLK